MTSTSTLEERRAEIEHAVGSLQGEFPAVLHSLRDSLARVADGKEALVNTLLLNAGKEDAEKLLAALLTLSELAPALKAATLASQGLESSEGRKRLVFETAEINAAKLSGVPERAAVPIARGDLVAVVKIPDVERDMQRLGLGLDELRAHYRATRDAQSIDALFAAYEAQRAALPMLQQFLRPEQIIRSDTLCGRTEPIRAGAVISFGGDDQLKLVSHQVAKDTPIIGVNSDPNSSFGMLLPFTHAELPELIERLEHGDYRLEAWTAIRAEIDGNEVPSSLDSLFLGDAARKRMSRHFLSKISADGTESTPIRQKGSGLLIATGSGSTGWFHSETWPFFPNGTRFASTAPYLRYFNTGFSAANGGAVERSGRELKVPEGFDGLVYPGEKLVVRSLNRSEGIASTDSFEEFAFGRGSVAVISVDPEPRWMVTAARAIPQS